jgi:uncharacterized phosphosugar-binding protein
MMETARTYLADLVARLADPALAAQLEPAIAAVVAAVRADRLVYVFGTFWRLICITVRVGPPMWFRCWMKA